MAAARSRILRVLNYRGVTYRRELERQVCEVGFNYQTTPLWERPEPHHFSEAIEALLGVAIEQESVQIAGTPYRFWMLANLGAPTKEALLRRKVAATEVFERISQMPPLSGWHAESIHHKALDASGHWLSVGWKGGRQIVTLGGHVLAEDKPGDVDLAGWHRDTAIPFVAQVKNGREWIYPPNNDIWDLLGAAAQLHAFPIFIARRLPERTFLFMKLVGGFAFRSTKMIFPPGTDSTQPLDDRPTFGQALADLGFTTDVDFIDDPLPRHRTVWTGAVNREIKEAYDRFRVVREEVLYLAYEEGLCRDRRTGRISNRDRKDLVDEFQRGIQERDHEERQAAMADAAADDPEPEDDYAVD